MEDDINFIKILRSIKKSNSIFSLQLAKAVRRNINPGDIKVFVFGKIFNPDTIVVSRSSSLNYEISLAGGAKFIEGPVKFISYQSDSTIEKRKFAFSRKNKKEAYKNRLLKSVDIISIKRNIFNFAIELLDEFTRPFIWGYAAEEIFTKFYNYL